MRAIAIVVVTLTLTACATAAMKKLSDAQRDDYMRCKVKVEEAQCGQTDPGDVTMAIACKRPLFDAYANAPDKKKWLVRHGCPKDMVE